MELGEKIRTLRLQKNLTLEELGNRVGVGKSTVRKWENGMIANMRRDKIAKLADALNVSPAYLMGWEESITSPRTAKGVKIPVLGMVHAGYPVDAIEDIIDWEEITPELAAKGDIMALQVEGDCMAPRCQQGDVVIVLMQSDADSGDVVIAMVNGDEAEMRQLKKFENGSINLIPLNPMYPARTYNREQIIELPVRILGKVVELRGKF